MTMGAEGHVIDGRFELLERLGGGGMGLVWRARDIVLHREVALKEVRPPDPELLRQRPDAAEMLRKRVLREAVSLARISHPNVVTIHHIVSSADVEHPWLVMELIPGGSFQDRLERGPCTPTEAARLGRGVLAGLRATHGAGILHRDVKPGNVLIRADGSPLLTDFGIAAVREATSLTNTGELIGSPDYMAPERLRGHDDEPSSDLWSLTMMLYVAVEGHHPMRRSSTLATLAAILEEDVPPPQRAGALGPVLQSVLIKDLTSRPDAESLDLLFAEAAGQRSRTVLSVPTVSATEPEPQPTPPKEAADVLPVEPADSTPAKASGAAAKATAAEPSDAREADADRGTTDKAKPVGRAESDPGGTDSTNSRPPAHRGTGRARRWLLIPMALAALTVGLVFQENLPFLGEDKPPADHNSPSSPTSSPTPDPTTPTAGPSPTVKENLRTPAGARKVIREIKRVTSRTTVTSFILDESYATAQVPSKDEEVWNSFDYRDGAGDTRESGGRMNGRPTFDLAKVNWDALPRLIQITETELGLKKGKVTLVDVSHKNGGVEVAIAASDAYGGAWLYADGDGKVLRRNKAS